MIRRPLWCLVLGCFFAAMVSGCASTPPVTYYALRSMATPENAPTAEKGLDMIIGIGSVDLPGTIDRTQIVVRSAPNQLSISAYHRWADYPNQMVLQALCGNLQTLLPDARVVGAPWPMGLKPDVTLAFKFFELIGDAEQQVVLSALWTLTAADPARTVSHRIHLTEPITGQGFDELAAAHSRVLEAFCRQVADALNAHYG